MKIDGVLLQVLLEEYREAIEWRMRAEVKKRDIECKLAQFGDSLDELLEGNGGKGETP